MLVDIKATYDALMMDDELSAPPELLANVRAAEQQEARGGRCGVCLCVGGSYVICGGGGQASLRARWRGWAFSLQLPHELAGVCNWFVCDDASRSESETVTKVCDKEAMRIVPPESATARALQTKCCCPGANCEVGPIGP